MTVRRNGQPLPLPPSRKTRALLAYLVRNPRQFRREYLCELLWEIPDDPRGSLRWSLSKIRKIVDDPDRSRVVADRNFIRLDNTDIQMDVDHLLPLSDSKLRECDTASLMQVIENNSGQFLEGLELTNFYEFHAWCIAEREKVASARSRILKELIRRLQDTPEKAVTFARALALNSPYDEEARAGLISLLMATGRKAEAEQQYQLGMRLLEELGTPSSGALFQAWRGAPGGKQPPAPVPEPTLAPAAPARLKLTGRETELQTLTEAMRAVVDRQELRFVTIDGPAGIGKSFLLDALAGIGKAEKFEILRSVAVEFEMLRPFYLWLDALRQSSSFGDTLFTDSEHENRQTLLKLLSEQIASRADCPLMILFDDIQWCDESSAAALAYLVTANGKQPLLVVVAGRDTEITDNTPLLRLLRQLRSSHILQEISLGPLDELNIEAIIRNYAPALAAEELSHQCAGNPLMAIELARAIASGGSSASLDQMIRERMSHFELPVIEVLRWASVLGQRIDIDTLSRVSGSDLDVIGEMLQEADQQGLLVPAEGGFRFSHDLVVKSIYNEISPARQKVMHRKVAQLLEANTALNLDFAADLAHHAVLSGDAGLAARALVLAGRLCLRFFAYQDALNLASRGMQLTRDLNETDRVRLLLDFHDIRLAAAPLDDWEGAATEYVELAEKALDHGEIAHARLGYTMASYVRWSHGQWAWAREQSLQAERVTRGGSEEDHIVGLAEAARCLAMLEQDLGKADAMLMEAKALADRKNIRIDAIPAARGMLCYYESRWNEAEEYFQEARTLAKSAGDRINEFQANEYLAMIDIERGLYERARHRCSDLLELGEKLREGSEGPFARVLMGLCNYALGDTAKAMDTALIDLRSADAKHRLAYSQNRAAMLDISRNHPASALKRATEALACASVLERTTEMLQARLNLAEAHLLSEDNPAIEDERTAITSMDLNTASSWARQRAEKFLNVVSNLE